MIEIHTGISLLLLFLSSNWDHPCSDGDKSKYKGCVSALKEDMHLATGFSRGTICTDSVWALLERKGYFMGRTINSCKVQLVNCWKARWISCNV